MSHDNNFFAPANLLENCLGLQELIALSPPDEKDRVGADMKNMIEPNQLHHLGSKKLEIRTVAAYGLPDSLTLESEMWPIVRYGGLRLKGELAQVSYIRVERINTLAWMIVDAVIREESPETVVASVYEIDEYEEDLREAIVRLPIDKKLTRPLYLPVGMIESVLIAA